MLMFLAKACQTTAASVTNQLCSASRMLQSRLTPKVSVITAGFLTVQPYENESYLELMLRLQMSM